LTKELLVTQAKIEELTILIELAKGDIWTFCYGHYGNMGRRILWT
jgi:hypothetical protein